MLVKRLYWGGCLGFTGLAFLIFGSCTWFEYTINMTSSLPGTIYVVHKRGAVSKGDLVAYRWQGGATYPKDTLFIKQVSGVAGDSVKVVGKEFWVNERYIGVAKEKSLAGVPLQPADGGSIKEGEIFVSTPHKDSLDSRYKLSGNIKTANIVGRAYEIF